MLEQHTACIVESDVYMSEYAKRLHFDVCVMRLGEGVCLLDPTQPAMGIVCFPQVDKTYYHMGAAERTRLKTFYEQCSTVPCLERAQVVDEKGGRLRLLLTPVGLQRLPCSTDEAKVGCYGQPC